MKTVPFTSLLLTLLFAGYAYGQVQSIRNGVLWRDTDGNRIQAHGTDILQHDGRYYLIGEDRTDNFSSYQGINLYVSDDLMNWEFLNKVVDATTNEQLGNPTLPRDERRFTERPNLVYNEQTQQFVIWAKYQNPDFNANEVAVFYSTTIDGDYTFHKAFQPRGFDTNDCSFFRDDDGSVYFITTHKGVNTPDDPTDNGTLNLYKLSDDYLDVEADPTFLFAGLSKEAPVLFKKDSLYYLLTSNKTGWRPNQGQYFTSSSLTSGWSAPKNFGNPINFDTQPTDVITISGTAGTSYYYVGDRWWDPRLPESKTIIVPMTIDGEDVTTQYVHEFTIDVTTGAWTAVDDNSYVPQDNWSVVSVSSEETTQTNNPATNAFDDDLNTIWHSQYSSGDDTNPHELVVDLGADYDVSGLMYIPRQDESKNGIVEDFQLYLSEDTTNWGPPVAAGEFSYWTELYFPQATARYLKFVTHSAFENTSQRFAAVAELRLMTNSEYDDELVQINSYYQINNDGFETGTEIDVSPGSKLTLGPQAQFDGVQSPYFGSYSWSGPNGFYSNERGITLDSLDASQAGEYTFYYLDDRYTCHTETITVNLTVTNVTARGESPSEVLVSWDAYPGRTGYAIEYREAGGSFTELARVGAGDTSYTHTGVTPGTEYEYRVAAILNEETLSTYSAAVSVTAPFIVVDYQDGDRGRTGSNVIKPQLRLSNEASYAVELNRLTVRYWFTVEDFSPLNFYTDYAALGKNKVKGTFVALDEARDGANYYLEMSFDTEQTIASQGTSGEIKTRIAKRNWTNFDEADDYSYRASDSYQPTQRITVYFDGKLIGGEEPEVSREPGVQLRVLHANRDAVANNAIKPHIRLVNEGNRSVALNEVTLRYWFSPEGSSPLNHVVEYAKLGKDQVQGAFYRAAVSTGGASDYFEVSFRDTSALPAFSETGEIKLRLHKQDWSSFDEQDDYSYQSASSYEANGKITAYVNGELVWGEEPADSSGSGITAINTLTVYPNTARETTTIRSDDPIETVGEMVVVDRMNVAHAVTVSQHDQQLWVQLPNLKAGPYIMRGTINGKPFTHRLLIE